MKFSNWIKKNKGVLVDALKSLFLMILKSQATGGLKGWLIKTIVIEFSKEVVEFIEVNIANIEIKHKVNRTINNEDRNEATDNLNDVFTI